MSGFLSVLLALLLVAITGVLFTGIAAMSRGGDFNRRYGNKLMRWRLILQGAAVVVIALIFFVNQG